MKKWEIMIVEDEVLIAAELAQQLNSLGYNVPVSVTSGEKALEKLAEVTPDLILMDIQLKGELDGIETAMHIHDHHKIPVIFLTAFADDTFLQKAKTSEPFGYLIKPIDIRELHSTIEMALFKAAAEREKEQLIRELQAALAENKILKGFIPICASCKKIRDDKGYWEQIEKYIQDHSRAIFSHSICPDCIQKLYPDLKWPKS
ncbi:MAG: response regulator [Proteobacteria bacterium]|nr:response regulator [Pseudomonadota bacterium]